VNAFHLVEIFWLVAGKEACYLQLYLVFMLMTFLFHYKLISMAAWCLAGLLVC